jgi:processive 1,2-diacylglycerol beta-glucosyltransferase
VAKSLASLGVPLAIATGRNQALREFLAKHLAEPNVHVYGQLTLEEMAGQMRSASLLVGKPGGLTTFESLTCGLPMVVYRPILIPGQEEENARYLESTDSGMVVDDLAGLRATVDRLLNDSERRLAMRRNAIQAAPAGAAQRIVELLKSNS